MVSCVFCRLKLPSRATREKFLEHLQDWHMMTEVEELTRAVGLVFATGELETTSTMVVEEASSTGVQGTSTSSLVVEEAVDSPVLRGGPRPMARVEQELVTGVTEVTEQESTSISRGGARKTTKVEQQATARATGVEQEQATTKAKEMGVEGQFVQGLLVETSGEEEGGSKRKRKKKPVKVEPKPRAYVETKSKGRLESKPKAKLVTKTKKFSVKLGLLDVTAPLARYKAMVVGKGFKCHVCDESMMSKGRLETHMRRRHGEARLKCPKEGCPAEFCTSPGLSFHKARCGKLGNTYNLKLKVIQCPMEGCDSMFARQSSIMKHMKTLHKSVKDVKLAVSVKCKICGEVSNNSARLADHMRKKHGEDKLECPKAGCLQKFFSKTGLSTHIFKKHGKTVGVKCGLCEEVRDSSRTMADHMRKEHGGAKLKCPKDGCSLEYYSKNGLKQHVKKFHRELNPGEEFKEEAEEADEVPVNEEQEEMEQEEGLEDVAEKTVMVAGEGAV